ncbi:hypothetical protein P1P75_40460, partial [Streptomyces sp. ID05-39B]|uniref:hypothetical protein n=1 Tax=Streptomyces sp. ID05-39B TaxID=3028664 RepID=UPI0029BC5CE7
MWQPAGRGLWSGGVGPEAFGGDVVGGGQDLAGFLRAGLFVDLPVDCVGVGGRGEEEVGELGGDERQGGGRWPLKKSP